MQIRCFLPSLLLLTCLNASAQASARNGKDYAVFFYVTTFRPGWQPLPGAKPEAESLQQELQANYGFSCELVPNPTRQQILDKVGAWNQRIGPNDQVLFFFSSHGHYDKASRLGYLIPADGAFRDEYFSTWLDYNSLRPYFARCKARNILVALDACHSGSFGNIDKGDPGGPDYHKDQDCQTQIDQAFRYQGRLYICSGNEDARTPGDSRFAAKFLELLRKGAPNPGGVIHFDDLHYQLGKVQNPEPVHGDFTGHRPGGDFVIVKKNACNTPSPPDRDGDGVADSADQCPDTWGSQPNGCPPELKPDDTARDLAAWKTAKQQNTDAAYREYLRQFPQGEFKDLANAALRQHEAEATRRRDDTAWEVATEKNTADGYKKYLADFPGGLHRGEAETQLKILEMWDNMVLIRGGTSQMGSSEGESDEKPVHRVTIDDFYLGKYEVTVAEFKFFVDDTGYQTDAEKYGSSWVYENGKWVERAGQNWIHGSEGDPIPDNYPVVNVSWNDAIEYCEWLSKKTGITYRLPTEAEWEYAAGNGTWHTKYSWGNDYPFEKKGGNVADETAKKNFSGEAMFPGYNDLFVFSAPVGSFDPNYFGLYDMTGNVWEWCADWYESNFYQAGLSCNPIGPKYGIYRVLRGGSWGVNQQSCYVTNRYFSAPQYRNDSMGFRLARTK